MRKLLAATVFSLILTGCNATSHNMQTGSYGQYSSTEPGEVVVEQLLNSQQSWDGATLPNYPDSQAQLTVLKVTIPPNTKLDWHKHQVINAAVITKGTLDVFGEGELKTRISAGDALAELVEKWHYGYNLGTEPVELIVFYAGTPGTELTIKKP